MSLEELLKDSSSSSTWKEQKKKLFRVTMGLSLAVVSLASVGLLVFTTRSKAQGSKSSPGADEKDVKSLAQLMTVQKDANDLQAEIRAMRKPSNLSSHRSGGDVGSRIISFDPGDGFASVSIANKDVYIPQGAVFQAQLITPIKTSIEKTFVLAETTHEFRMDMTRKIPIHSRLVGRSRLNPVLKGVIVEFDTLVLPTGIETRISGLALSRNALPEIDGIYFSNDLESYGTALAFGFLSGFADAGRETVVTPVGPVPTVTVNNQVLAGLSNSSFQVAEDILRDIRNRSVEYVVVPAGERIFVALTSRYDIFQGGKK